MATHTYFFPTPSTAWGGRIWNMMIFQPRAHGYGSRKSLTSSGAACQRCGHGLALGSFPSQPGSVHYFPSGSGRKSKKLPAIRIQVRSLMGGSQHEGCVSKKGRPVVLLLTQQNPQHDRCGLLSGGSGSFPIGNLPQPSNHSSYSRWCRMR